MENRRQTQWILAAIVLGIVGGMIPFQPLHDFFVWGGTLFIRLLKMVIIPLIFSSILCGILNAGGSSLGRLGAKTLAWYLGTSLLAVLSALLLFNLVRPGAGANAGGNSLPDFSPATDATIGDILLRMVPTNVIQAMGSGDTLAVIFFAVVFAIAATRLQDSPRELIERGSNALLDAMMQVTHWVIALAPIGILCLVGKAVSQLGLELFRDLVPYFFTVLGALLLHSLLVLPLLLRLVGGISPRRYGAAMSPALIMAFSTSSSSATLPVSISCAEERAGVSNRVGSFVLPLGATINMDGTALYECGVALFIAQYYGLELGLAQQMLLVLTCLMTSVAAAGIPMASIALIPIILAAVGLPEEGIALVIVLDRVLDMCRTTVNVWSDSCGAAVIARSEGETLFLPELQKSV